MKVMTRKVKMIVFLVNKVYTNGCVYYHGDNSTNL